MPPKAMFDVAGTAKRHASGERLGDIAKEPGMPCAATIGRHLRADGFRTWASRRRVPDIGPDILRRLHWDQGLSSEEIGRRHGASASAVRRQLKKHGLQKGAGRAAKKRGADNPNWRGGVYRSNGYVFVRDPSHPNAMKSGYVAAHRRAAAEKLGRPLLPHEEAHHIDGNKENNAASNIEVITKGPHQRLHAETHRELLSLRRRVKDLEGQLSARTPLKVVG